MLTDLRILVVDTGRVWWRLLPRILSLYLLGWLGSQLILRLAVILGDISGWLTLVLFAATFVCTLVAAVLILRLAGVELGIRELLPADEVEVDDRDTSVSRLLVITLLPFLGMYAAFGQVAQAAASLQAEQFARYGIGNTATVNGVLFDLVDKHLIWAVLLIVGVYVLRRVVDRVAEHTGLRLLGLVTVLIEAFFMLLIILGGIRVFQTFMIWLRNRELWGWFAAVKRQLAEFAALFKIDLPAILVHVASFFSDQVWPVLTEVLTQPLLWLAVAALVYGSRVLSLAELWRKGQTYAERVPGASMFARYRDKRAQRRIGPPPQGVALAGSQVKEAFFGDIDDKYLPTFHSMRLVLRAGVLFLGSYVLAYSLVIIAQNYFTTLVHLVTGGHESTFWIRYAPVIELLETAPFETVRLCLLAVAFRRCLEVFRLRTAATAVLEAPVPAAQPAVRPAVRPAEVGAVR